MDEHVVSLALLRIRAAENSGPLTVICSDTVQAEKYCAEVNDWIHTLNLSWRAAVLPDGPAGRTAAIAETETARTKVLYESLKNPPDFLFASVAAVL